ncbi:MAG: lytic transglycosylase domain-containing protein [Bacteroidetes bacterium]|nr:MAG: lytic transglycosylase domain-containing protein [Bacteroidota bacterium]
MKSFFIFIITIALSQAGYAKGVEKDSGSKKPIKDTSAAPENLEERGFKNLFSSDNFNAAQPYDVQINPNAVPFIDDYLRRHGKSLEAMKSWGQPYFRLMDNILSSYGLPKELKYLAVIESHLQNWATSWVGAVGPWQFMPETGRRMGLTISGGYDERTNYFKSTHAAARYLKELYGQLGDWLLVIAAYNGGPGRVFTAMRRSGSTNFWDLQNYLPTESRNHVKKFIGTHYLMEGNGGLTTTSRKEWTQMQVQAVEQTTQLQASLTPEQLEGTEVQNISGKYHSVVLANSLAMDIGQFNQLNPNFDKLVTAEKGYDLRLPKFKLELFNANRYIILHQSILTILEQSHQTVGYPEPKARKKAK